MFVSFEQKIECPPLLVTNVKKEITSLDQFLQVFIAVVVHIVAYIFIKYIVFYYEIQLKYCQYTDVYR
jgi:hypothetical protein